MTVEQPKMPFQDDPLLAPWINHYACAINALAAYRVFREGKSWDVHEWGAACHLAVFKGIVSGDLNHDGDMDDPGEACIQDWDRLIAHLELPLKFVGKFDLDAYPRFTSDRYWVLTAWRWKYTHWVIGNERPVLSDSITGGSYSVKNGAPAPLGSDGSGGLRVFEVK